MTQKPTASATDARAEAAATTIRGHLERGAPWDACDVFREAVAAHPHDGALLYLGALAHARAGAASEAHALLDRAQAAATSEPERLADILSLRGRLWKDRLHRGPDATGRRDDRTPRARRLSRGLGVAHDPYPGINAATLSMLLGERAAARSLALEIEGRFAAQTAPPTCWDHATAGEAHLLLGQLDAARASYAAACALATGDAGTVATMRRQVHLLSRVLPEAADVLDLLPAASVLAFAGHMIDARDRPVPRFPAALEPAVAAAIRAHLARAHQPIVYASAACGADLLCIEAALDAGRRGQCRAAVRPGRLHPHQRGRRRRRLGRTLRTRAGSGGARRPGDRRRAISATTCCSSTRPGWSRACRCCAQRSSRPRRRCSA